MTDASDPEKDMLARYLHAERDGLLWKLDGLTERQVRLPMTRTGTNLLGLLKHVGSVAYGYFGDCFGRPAPEPVPWFADGAELNADMWATPDESREFIVGFYRRAWEHADLTIDELGLDAIGTVPWWSQNGTVTLRRIMVHMIDETARHAGHADIVRELLDGGAGLQEGNSNLPDRDEAWWTGYRARLQEAAARFPE